MVNEKFWILKHLLISFNATILRSACNVARVITLCTKRKLIDLPDQTASRYLLWCLILPVTPTDRGMLTHYATSRKVVGSIPDKIIGIFRRTASLGSIQPLRQMTTRNVPGGKGRPGIM
jgi:hypothetical protein